MGYHYSPHVTTDGLVMYLDGAQFTSGSTIWRDISRGNFNSASLVNGPIYNPTSSLGSVTTDGSNDFIMPRKFIDGFEYGPHWDLNWTFEYWMRPDWSIGPQTYKDIYSGYYGIPYVVQAGIRINLANTQGSTSTTIGVGGESTGVTPATVWLGPQNNNRWMHLAIVSNGTDVRLYYNGILQSTTTTNWATGLGRVNCVEDIKIDSNGKVLVGGSFYKYRDEIIGYGLTRLNTDGTRDTTFTPPAFGYKVSSIALSGSTIYATGWWRYMNPNPGTLNLEGVTTLNNTGSRIDYMRTGFFDQQLVYRGKIHPTNGKLYIATLPPSAAGYRFNRINNNLTLDTTYASGAFNDAVRGFDFDSTGSIYVGGLFTTYSGSSNQFIVKLNQNGNKDTSFTGFAAGGTGIWDVKVDSNDKIYIAGFFTTYSGSAMPAIGRINPNGTRDATFNPGAGFNSTCRVLAIDNNGKIYAGGDFTTYSGSTVNRIVRINTDGTRDATFNMGTGFDNSVKAIAVDSNNKVYVGGNFFNYSGSAVNGMLRLNEDGTIDNTFNYGTGFTRANARPITTTPAAFDVWPMIGGYIIGFTKIELGSFKLYNKALSAQEVGQNYSATRGRYGV